MKQYHDLCKYVIENGDASDDRTGTGTIKTFGYQMRFDLSKGFPLVTTKKVPIKSLKSELLWFISGSKNERDLAEILHGTRDPEKRTIWTDNFENQGIKLGYENGDLGPVYGYQWRNWEKYTLREDSTTDYKVERIDQLAELINGIKSDPNGRRHILTAWNVADIEKMALPPCHCFAQFFVSKGKLSCQLYQRSCDVFLGVPFNIASYAMLTHMIAQVCDLSVGDFVWTGGDVHIYNDHIEQVQLMLSRDFKELPTIELDQTITNIDDFTMDSIKIVGYDPHDTIKAKMAV